MNLREEFQSLEVSPRKLREFGLLIGGIVLTFAGFAIWRGKDYYPYLLAAGVPLVFFGAVQPAWLKPLYRAWMGLALLLGWVVSRILLAFIFYAVVTPIGLIARMNGKKFLDLTFPDRKDSYWILREKPFSREECEKQF
jgi:multisubunit Na+/H+ antiporter MnhG subunit